MEEYFLILRSFIIYNLYDLTYGDMEMPSMSFDFKEEEAKEVITKLINNELKINCGSIDKDLADALIEVVNLPIYSDLMIEINDYKRFFSNLSKIYNNTLDTAEKQNIIKYIWLRMTPNDLKHPEEFLERNANALKDTTFNKYLVEKVMENEFFKDYTLTVKNLNSHFFNESMKEIKFTLIKDDIRCELPVVRYNIFERGNEKICEIGSIQHILNYSEIEEEKELANEINKLRNKINKDYKAIKNVDKTLLDGVEPKKLISLFLFIKLLQDNGIKRISVPSEYPFDEAYHIKRIELFETILKVSHDDEKTCFLMSKYNRIDEICKTKSENFIKLFKRVMYHIDGSKVITPIDENNDHLEIEIPNLDNVNGENIKKLIKN